MSKKSYTYDHYQKFVKDKDTSVDFLINNYLNKTQSMFIYEGLPETIPAYELEKILQTTGSCFITKVGDDLFALKGTYTGEQDVYGNYTKYLVTNPYINLSKTYDIKNEGVIFKNDTSKTGLLPIIGMYAVLLTDSKISLNVMDLLTRMMLIISASDDTTKESAEVFIKKIANGEISVIGENAFFEGIKTHTGTGSNNVQITQLIELNQYHKANLMNELGLNANFNMKRERLNESEIGLNIDGLLPFTHNMLHCRREAIEKLNKMYDLDVKVDFHSAWKLEHEQADRLINHIDTDVAEEQGKSIKVINETDEPTLELEPETVETIETDETDETNTETIETDETAETGETTDENQTELDFDKDTEIEYLKAEADAEAETEKNKENEV